MSSFYKSETFSCLAPTEAAKALGISRSKLFSLLARGEIKAHKLGSRTLIDVSELARYFEALPEAQFHSRQEKRG